MSLMKLVNTSIEGCYEIMPFNLKDHRGRFVKPYHRDDFKESGLDFDLSEEFYSVSKKGARDIRSSVCRGVAQRWWSKDQKSSA